MALNPQCPDLPFDLPDTHPLATQYSDLHTPLLIDHLYPPDGYGERGCLRVSQLYIAANNSLEVSTGPPLAGQRRRARVRYLESWEMQGAA